MYSRWLRYAWCPSPLSRLVNLAAGAARIPLADYVLGTVIGMAPGLILLSALGHQVLNIITEPTWTNMALFVLAVLGWVAISVGVQALLLRTRSPKTWSRKS